MDAGICTAFCAGLSGLFGDNAASVIMVLGSGALMWAKNRKDIKHVRADVAEASGRASRAEGRAQQAEERAQRATEHAQLMATRMPASGYEMVVRPSSPQRGDVGPIADRLEQESEPEAAFSTRNFEHIRAEIGLQFDEHGNRVAPRKQYDDERPAAARHPREPQPPKRRT